MYLIYTKRRVIAINNQNLSPEQLLRLLAAMKSGESSAEAAAGKVIESLPEQKKAQLQAVLKDKETLKKIMNSDSVRELLKKYGK